MKFVLPHKTAPMGHPKPLLKQKQTESTSRTTLRGVTFRYVAAFINLAPSMWMGMLCSAAMWLTFSNQSKGKT